jgi:serine/threonine-protein kinase
MKSLAKRVEDRYQSAAAMRGDIERYLAGHPVHVTPPPPPVEPPTTVTAPTTVTPVPPPQPEYEPEPEERGTRPGLIVFLAILLVIILGLAAYLLPKMFASPTDQVNVPKVTGLTQAQARTKLADAGFTVGQPQYGYSSKVPANHVISQDPAADDLADKGSTVTFTLSRGTHPTTVPYVIGQTRAQAQAAMIQAHLKPVFQKVQSDQPKGTVTKTEPGSGQQVPRGTPVTISIAEGPQKVPNVVGLMEDAAVAKLKQAGFNPQVNPDTTSTEPKGTVTGQTPNAGQPLQQGSTVYITVSQYEPSSPPTSSPPTSGPPSPPTSGPSSPTSS